MRDIPADALRATVALTAKSEGIRATSDVELDHESLADAVHATAVDRVTSLVEVGEVAYGERVVVEFAVKATTVSRVED